MVQITGQTTETKGGDQPLTSKVENLEAGDQIEVGGTSQTLTVLSINTVPILEARVQASDGKKYDLRETRLEDDVLEIEPRKILSEPQIVREIEVAQ